MLKFPDEMLKEAKTLASELVNFREVSLKAQQKAKFENKRVI